MSEEVMGKVARQTPAKLARRPGDEFPGSRVKSHPRTIAADSPYADRLPVIQGALMSPASVSSVLRMAELGYMSRYTDLLSECREKVPHLQSVLAMRELAVSGCRWEVTPRDHGERSRKNAKATKVADYVRRRIEEIPNFGEAIQHLMSADYFGRAGLEKEYKRDADGIGIAYLHPIHPKRLSYAANWRVHLWDEGGNELDPRLSRFPGIDIEAEYPGKFIIHTPRTMGGEIPTRQGLGRVLCWYAMFWLWSHRDWMKYAELFGQPWRVAYYEKVNADEDDIAVIKQALQEMSTQTTAVLPSTTKFQVDQPTGRSTVHESLRNAINAEMSKLVLGQTLTTEASPNGKSGSQALGKVHDNVRADVKHNCGRAISERLQFDLVEDLVLKQFGAEALAHDCPRFELITQAPDDIDKEFTRAMGLADRGVPIGCDDAREHFTTLPAPEEDSKPGTLLTPTAKVGVMPDMPIDPDQTIDEQRPLPPAPAGGPPGSPGAATKKKPDAKPAAGAKKPPKKD